MKVFLFALKMGKIKQKHFFFFVTPMFFIVKNVLKLYFRYLVKVLI